MALELQGLTHRFDRRRGITDVNVTVRPGDCYGFIGHNGAGKTTTMRIALGLLIPRRGQVHVDGIDARRHPRQARTLVSGLCDTPRFYGHLSGRRNLRALGKLQGLAGATLRDEVARVLSLVGLDDAARLRFSAYSQGMRQRLGIAQALLGNPRYVILDEPTNGLDPEGIAEMRDLFRRMTEEGVAVMLSTHQLHEVGSACNRIGLIREGRMLVEEETGVLLGADVSRCTVTTDDDERAATALRGDGYDVRRAATGLRVDAAERGFGALSRFLVGEGLEVRSLEPERSGLEDVYLRHARDDATNEPPADASTKRTEAAEVTPPSRPVWRVARHEFGRVFSRWHTPLLLAIPAILGAWSIISELVPIQERNESNVAAGVQFSATNITAFKALALGMERSLPLLLLILTGMASQVIAAERSDGTLRNLMTRPLTRAQLLWGKTLTTLLIAALTYALTIAGIFAVAGWHFDYTGVADVLANGLRIEHVSAEDLWEATSTAFWRLLPAILSFTCLGILMSTVMGGAVGSLTGALGLTVLMDFSRAFVLNHDAVSNPDERIEHLLPTTHVPTFLGDRSYLEYFKGRAGGANDVVDRFQDHAAPVIQGGWWSGFESVLVLPAATWVPAIFGGLCLLLAHGFFRRRSF